MADKFAIFSLLLVLLVAVMPVSFQVEALVRVTECQSIPCSSTDICLQSGCGACQYRRRTMITYGLCT